MFHDSFNNFPRAQDKYKSDTLILNFINMSDVQANKNPTDHLEAIEYRKYSENGNQINESDNSELKKMKSKFYKSVFGASYEVPTLEGLRPDSRVHLYLWNDTGGLIRVGKARLRGSPKYQCSYAGIFNTMLCQRSDPVTKLSSHVQRYYLSTSPGLIRTNTSALTDFLRR